MASIDPNETAAAIRTAREAIQQGRLDDALRILQQTVQSNPRSTEAYELMGVAYAQKGMHSEGIQALSTAVNLKPESVFGRINLAVAYQRANRLHEAEFQLKEALRLDPGNEKARQALNAVQTRLGTATVQAPAAPPQSVPAYAEATGSYTHPQGYAPPPGYAQQPTYGQPGAYGQAPPGYGQPPPYGPPGYGPQAGYGAAAYGVPTDPTGWSPLNLGPILARPVEFFQGQRGQRDLLHPLAYLNIMFVLLMVFTLVVMLTMLPIGNAPAGFWGQLFGRLLIAVLLMVVILSAGLFICTAIYHGMAAAFAGTGGYYGTFRAVVYASTPSFLLGALTILFMRMVYGSMDPYTFASISEVVKYGSWIWCFVLLVVAYREIHDMPTANAFFSALIGTILIIGLIYLLGMALGSQRYNPFSTFSPGGGFGSPGYSQPFTTSPTFPSNPGFNNPGFGNPSFGNPSFGNPNFGPPSGFGGPPSGFGAPPPGFGSPNFGRPSFGGPPPGFPR